MVCRDIGLGGAFVSPPGALAVGLRGQFRAPAALPSVSVPARVVREGEGSASGAIGLALEFLPPDAATVVRLARALRSIGERRRSPFRMEAGA
ncbi:MAG: PilZ domain-containing protein [Acidobacteria bacterium]|nr:MAG: PilZ domain-containing protein [Acidobacteriota bacterium]